MDRIDIERTASRLKCDWIIFYASDYTMGDHSESDCDRFMVWAKEQLEQKYPDHDIMVKHDSEPSSCYTDDIDHEAEIADFCFRLLEGESK